MKGWARLKRCCERGLLGRMPDAYPGLVLIATVVSLATAGSLTLLVWQLHAAPAENSDASVGSLHVDVQDAATASRLRLAVTSRMKAVNLGLRRERSPTTSGKSIISSPREPLKLPFRLAVTFFGLSADRSINPGKHD